ncbi:MAG TPA: hypothetical protein VF783_17825 [Terriglobales bacterium]
MPHWALKRRARALGLARTKELPWSEAELGILARYAWMSDERTHLKLKDLKPLLGKSGSEFASTAISRTHLHM